MILWGSIPQWIRWIQLKVYFVPFARVGSGDPVRVYSTINTLDTIEGLFVPFARVGSGDPVRVYSTMNTLDTIEAFIAETMYNLSLPNLCATLDAQINLARWFSGLMWMSLKVTERPGSHEADGFVNQTVSAKRSWILYSVMCVVFWDAGMCFLLWECFNFIQRLSTAETLCLLVLCASLLRKDAAGDKER